MVRYIYDHPDWPAFRWDKAALADELGAEFENYLSNRPDNDVPG